MGFVVNQVVKLKDTIISFLKDVNFTLTYQVNSQSAKCKTMSFR
jgi:hypothetical protein